ncbi:hypothetical protein OGAPHI_003992 [Ogataea philodendri]|uniref:Uncharacterized protein n=1 Tax=Ogataea philodendri TaxID=1378263 RepID=A0A9P8P701_9ASCO|nr:uncharacterized protein OGAPHI_003992 [Ogataea philodendri]KAH3665804.1 hypothetical protein OGAPHI_003992 [Ogataea philodendri]
MFVYAANKVNEQDANRSLAKRKKTFTEEEWEEQLSQIKRKQLVFDDSTKFYLVPFGAHKEAKVEELKSALGPNTAVIDLNELIKQQMDSPESTYGALLGKTLDGFDTNKSACFYTFTYRLAPGLFTKLVKTTSQKLKAQNPELTNFVLLNYPNTIPEAIKFEQDVAVAQKLVLLDNQETDSNIVDYFRTVNKVADLDQLKK